MSSLKVRKYDFNIEDVVPTNWHDGNIVKTLFFDALSAVIPKGESYFIMAVREYLILSHKGAVTLNSESVEEIQSFVKQEHQHRVVHEKYNKALLKKGFDVTQSEKRMADMFSKFDKGDPIRKIAITAALEHFFCSLGIALISNPYLLKGAHPELKNLWLWHSLEEIEHCGVAYTLYKEMSNNNYWLRINLYCKTMYKFFNEIARNFLSLLKKEQHKSRLNLLRSGLYYFFCYKGFFWTITGNLLKYFSPFFDPTKNSDAHSKTLKLKELEAQIDQHFSTQPGQIAS